MKLQSDNVWFTSDTHYAHNNICRGVSNWITSPDYKDCMTRDFTDLEEMNKALVNGINSVVEQNDWLIHLGDWSFGGFEKIQEFREQINCKNIVLLIGNHDQHIQNDKKGVRKLFTHVANYEEMRVTQGKNPTNTLVLCHYPIISWNGMYQGTKMLHGHQHLKGENRFTQNNRMDVGICGNPEFRPYHLEEILKDLFENRKDVNKILGDVE
jgi:calcineurin-like phosphoesterase family protein